MGLESFEAHFLTLFFDGSKSFFKLAGNLVYKVLRWTSAGKTCITCQRPSENFFKTFLGRTSGGENILLQTFFFLSGGHRQSK